MEGALVLQYDSRVCWPIAKNAVKMPLKKWSKWYYKVFRGPKSNKKLRAGHGPTEISKVPLFDNPPH